MFTINKVIEAIYVQKKPYGSSNGNLKIYIPKLMSQISMGIPKTTPVTLNKSCYINAADCKPTIASKINTQNYVTAMAPYNRYEESCYRYGSSIKVIPKDEDCLVCRLSPEDEDNSFNP